MCLAVPMKLEKVIDGRRALVSQGNVTVEVDVSLLADPKPGDQVIIHAGYAIETLTLEDAEERAELFRQLGEISGGGPGSSRGTGASGSGGGSGSGGAGRGPGAGGKAGSGPG
jgi:hydrogenase expression/formation protein HypC